MTNMHQGPISTSIETSQFKQFTISISENSFKSFLLTSGQNRGGLVLGISVAVKEAEDPSYTDV